ncbi:TPA: restriction endonuclease subunit S, partial [Vibrio parahaemolyticus]|nr:restriction endonuclease subunit S [Vibrio parahaemolyticus]
WPKGTLCITIAANIADTATLGFDACFPDSVVGYTPYDKEIPTVYFDYFIKTAKENLERFAPSTAQKNINLEILSNVLVPCPPMQQFPRIVEKVNLLLGI